MENSMIGSKVPRENRTIVGMDSEAAYDSAASRTPLRATELALSSSRSIPCLVRSQVADMTRWRDCLRAEPGSERVEERSSMASDSEPLLRVRLDHMASLRRTGSTPSPRSEAKVTACSRDGRTCMLMVMHPMTDGASPSIFLSSA